MEEILKGKTESGFEYKIPKKRFEKLLSHARSFQNGEGGF